MSACDEKSRFDLAGEASIPEPQIYCGTCRKWLRRPAVAGYAVFYCPSCDGCLEVPRLWQDASRQLNAFADESNTNIRILSDSVIQAPFSAPRPDVTERGEDFTEGTAEAVEVPPVVPMLEELGPIREVHRTPPPWQLALTLLGVILIFLAFLALGAVIGWRRAAPGDELRGICAISALAIGVFSGVLIFLRDLFRPVVILVFHGGLAQVRGPRVDLFAWSNVAAYFEGYPGGERTLVGRIQRRDGRVLALNRLDGASQRKLDDLARKEVWARLFPAALKEFENGGTVFYGQIGVSNAGLVRKGRTLPWGQVARIRIEKPDMLVIRQRRSLFSWFKGRIRKIPNFFILRHFIHGRAEITQEG